MSEELQLEYDLESPTNLSEQPEQRFKYLPYLFRFLLVSSLVSIIIPYIPPLNLQYLKSSYYIIPLSMFCIFHFFPSYSIS